MSGFVHLHVHSEYSLLDGAARIDNLAAKAAELGMKALALTDHGVMYGVVPFYKACRKHGIKPIIGCEVYFTGGSLHTKSSRQDQPIYHLILLAKNATGYRNLMKLCSVAHLEGFHYKPRIDMEHLREHAEGLICLSSCLGGEISQQLLADRKDEARLTAERFRDVFGEDYFLELQDHGVIEQKKVMQGIIELSRETGIPLVATNDVHYIHEQDHAVQDVLLCIGTGKTVEDDDRLKFQSTQLYLKSAEQMERLFAHVPEAVANTGKIAERCELELAFGQSILPRFSPIPDGMTAGDYLTHLCAEGLVRRYGGKPGWESDTDYRLQLEERLRYELGVIDGMGFSDYFLIVWDFIRFAHENGITTGPGRGSSAGSLVAYVLGITNVDPIGYKLLFERFLNPERVTMPDIDIDFNDERREEVIDYVVRKYGTDHVAQIITFGSMAAKAAVRDVGRALNVPFMDVDRAAKLIPAHLGITLEQALVESPELKAAYDKNAKTTEMLDMAIRVEGMPRHASTHAAGVVISRDPLTDYVPLQEGTGNTPLTQYPMEDLEAIGLLKMDFLGLRNISIIDRTQQRIQELYRNPVDFNAVSDHDPATYELLGRGETTGIFQLESPGMRRVLRDLKPTEFEDIISVLALFRPGPMEFIPKYIQAKHGLIEVDYPHPSLVPILKDTYGIIVYQEQIMQIASRMAGFTLGEADLLRRAVSKKKREILDQERTHFVGGSLRQGFTEADANHVYDMIVRFADYGFPRAHATAYAVLAFQTAYLKAHYPAPFMAALLTAAIGSQRKVAEYIDDCRRMGIEVLPPDVNESGVTFTPVRISNAEGDGGDSGQRFAIRFGLAAIKNVGTHAIEAITVERQEKPFDNVLDFCRRVDLRICNKRVVESLIMGGAFDSLPGHRAQLLAMLEETMEAALKWKKERDDLQLHLFGFTEEANWEVEYPNVRPYSQTEQLEIERELLGLYLSGHPLDAYEALLQELEIDPIPYLQDTPDMSDVLAAGMIVSVKTIVTKKGQQMAFLEIEDKIDRVEVVLFPETWKRHSALVEKGALLLVRAKLQHADEGFKLLADQLCALADPNIGQLAARMRQPAARTGGAGGQAERRGGSVPAAASPGRTTAPARPTAGPVQAQPARPQRPTPAREYAGAGIKERINAPAPGSAPRRVPQRIFVKIAADREQPIVLEKLKALLKSHNGPLQVVLFYERGQKTIALGDAYPVKPSPELFLEIEKLLGAGTAKVK